MISLNTISTLESCKVLSINEKWKEFKVLTVLIHCVKARIMVCCVTFVVLKVLILARS